MECSALSWASIFHSPSQGSGIIAERVERFSEPEAVNDYEETVFAGHSRAGCTHELTVVVAVCTGPAQSQVTQQCQHGMERGGQSEVSLLAAKLSATDSCWEKISHALLKGPIPESIWAALIRLNAWRKWGRSVGRIGNYGWSGRHWRRWWMWSKYTARNSQLILNIEKLYINRILHVLKIK